MQIASAVACGRRSALMLVKEKDCAQRGTINTYRDMHTERVTISRDTLMRFSFVFPGKREKERFKLTILRLRTPRTATVRYARGKYTGEKVRRDKRDCCEPCAPRNGCRAPPSDRISTGIIRVRTTRRETNCRMPQMRQALPTGAARRSSS